MKVPEGLREVRPGILICAKRRYYPEPGNWDLYTEPDGPKFGAAAKGQVYNVRRPFGLVNNPRKFASVSLDWMITEVTGTVTVASLASLLANQTDVMLKGTPPNGLINLVGSLYSYGNVHVRNVQKPSYTLVAVEELKGATSASAPLCPLRSAIVVKKETGKAGREFQGRLFLPPPVESVQAAGVLAATAIPAINNSMAIALSGTLSDGGGNGAKYVLCVISEKNTKATGSLVATPCTKLLVRSVLGTMRARQRFGVE